MAKNVYKSNCYNGGIQCMLDAFSVPSHHIIHNFSSPLPLPTEPTPRFVIRPRPGAGSGGLGGNQSKDPILGFYMPPGSGDLGLREPDDPK
jgi:hypothetical protein